MADDDAPLSFDELRDALIPPGADKDAVWAALKGAQVTGDAKQELLGKIARFHQTGGHVPGRQAPDISLGGSQALRDALEAAALRNGAPVGTTCAGCQSRGIVTMHSPAGDEHREWEARWAADPDWMPEGAARDWARVLPCQVCRAYHPQGTPCRSGPSSPLPADPFAAMTPGAVAATAMNETFRDLLAGGFTEDQALTFLARAWASRNGDSGG